MSSNYDLEETPKCSPIICPVHHFSGCEWRGPSESIVDHCSLKHSKSIQVTKDFPHVIVTHGNVFLFWLRKLPSGFISVRLHSMKCCMDPNRYEGIITFRNGKKVQQKLDCYSSFYYERGFDRLDDTKIMLNTSEFLEDDVGLRYDVCIKDNTLQNLLSII